MTSLQDIKILISRFIVRQDWEEDKGIKSKCIEIGKRVRGIQQR